MALSAKCIPDYFKGIIKPLGLVFGDIGTSPLYTLTIAFLLIKITPENVIGVISLVIWTLIIIVFIQYAWLAMSLGKDGEGGTIVLREILMGLLKSNKAKAIVTFLTFVGVSLFIGNNVITPAISILSAVEGIKLVPGCEKTHLAILVIIACLITIALFAFQQKGTDKVSIAFGPIMFGWFSFLGISGLVSFLEDMSILQALNPLSAITFIVHNSVLGLLVLSMAFLCATGGEVLYADMGHLGKEPIVKGWYFVFICLVLCYLGQGSYLLHHPETKTVLFEMVSTQSKSLFLHLDLLYIFFLILSIMATVIASQATISGMFSIVYQGITTRIMPMVKIDYTSPHMRSQIYIDSINWILMVLVLVLIIGFKESSMLGEAYGLAVAGTMTLTGVMMVLIFYLKKKYIQFGFAVFITIVDILFFIANSLKIPQGGYWSIVIAMFPLAIIIIYNMGQKRLYKSLLPTALDKFLEQYNDHYQNLSKIQGMALYFARDVQRIPPYIVRTMIVNHIIYEENVIFSIVNLAEPYGIEAGYTQDLAPGLKVFEVKTGYMELINVTEILENANIHPRVIFYGIEDIVTEDTRWKIFSFIKRITPSFVKFYKTPSNKIQGVVTQIDM